MKNITRLIVLVLLGLMTVGAKAQYSSNYNYGYQYSGHTVGYHVPHRVKKVVGTYHHHYGFDWVGTTEYQRGPKRFYIITFRKGNRFVELTMNRRGEIVKRGKYSIDYRDRRPYRRVYANRHEIYHRDGYVYSRREDRRRYDYPWNHDWKNWDDQDSRENPSGKLKNDRHKR